PLMTARSRGSRRADLARCASRGSIGNEDGPRGADSPRWRSLPPYGVEKCASVAISEAGEAPARPLLPNDSGRTRRAAPERNAERGTRNAERETRNAKRGTRNAARA